MRRILVLSALAPVALVAVTLSHAFSNGAIADADDVNANFADLATAVTVLETTGVGRKVSISAPLAPGQSTSAALDPIPQQLLLSAWASFDSGQTFQGVPLVPPSPGNYAHGNGQHGAFTGSGTFDQPRSAIATAVPSGSTTVTLATAVGINAGELVLLLQARGTTAGAWSIHRVVARNGTVLTLDSATTVSYDTTSPAVAVAQRVPEFTTATIAGTLTAPAWDGTTGGVLAFYASGAVQVSGSVTAAGRGWRGGANATSGSDYVFNNQGEGQMGTGLFRTTSSGTPNGTGGGSGCGQSGGGGGAGSIAGSAGVDSGCFASGQCVPGPRGATGAAQGASSGSLLFGGGGGSSGSHSGGGRDGAAGGAGGGIVFIHAPSITVTGSISAGGGNGVNGYFASSAAQPMGGGGGGAGGTVRLVADALSLGANLVTATGGAGGGSSNGGSCNPSGAGGSGGAGRVVVLGGAPTGTTLPAALTSSTTLASGLFVTLTAGGVVTVTSQLPQPALVRVDLAQ